MSSDEPTSSFGTISFHFSDKLRFLQFPKSIYHDIRPVLVAVWAPGIQSEDFYGDSYQYQFQGRPFGAFGDEAGVASRRLVRDILAFLYERSWLLVTTICSTKQKDRKDTLIFRQRQEPAHGLSSSSIGPIAALPSVEWLVVAPQGSARLRFIYDNDSSRKDLITKTSGRLMSDGTKVTDAESAALGSSQLVPHDLGLLLDALKSAFDKMGCAQTGDWNQDSFEFKLKDKLWRPRGENTVKSRLLLLKLIETLDRLGWRSYASLRHRTEGDDHKKSDTWYFVRPRDWVRGSPFNGELATPLLD